STAPYRTTGSRRSRSYDPRPSGTRRARADAPRAERGRPDGAVRQEQDPIPRIPVARAQRRARRRLLLSRRGADRAHGTLLRRGELCRPRATIPPPSLPAHSAHRLRLAPALRADQYLSGPHPGRRPRLHRVPEATRRAPVPGRLRTVPPHPPARTGARLPDLEDRRGPLAPPRPRALHPPGR